MANPDVPESDERDAATVAAVAAAILGALLALGGLAIYGAHVALSIAIGALIAVANLVTMSAIIRALLKPPDDAEAKAEASVNASADANADASADEPRPTDADHVREGRRGGAAWGIFAAVKIIVLFGGIWVLLTRGWVDPIPLVVGYGVLPMGIAISGFATNLAPKNRKKRR